MATIAETFVLGFQHHQAGRLEAAEQAYRQVLQAAPQYPDAWHLLGLVSSQFGNHQAAVEYIGRAIQSNPQNATFHSNLGLVLQQLHNLEEAAACFRRAVELEPGFAEAHTNLGIALRTQGKLDDAVSHFRRAAELKPNDAAAQCELGSVFQAQGKSDEATRFFRRAMKLKPDYAKTLYDQGNHYRLIGKLDDAVACYRRALDLAPEYTVAHNNLGVTLEAQGRLAEAAFHYRRAVELTPDDELAYNNLGNVMQTLDRLDESESCYRETLRLRSGFPEAHNNLANTLQKQGRLAEAQACYQEALRQRPDFSEASHNLLCCMNYDPGVSPSTLLAEHRAWAARYAPATTAALSLRHVNDPSPERRLRVGYVSPDFCSHAAAHFIEPILANHSPREVEVFCYAEVAKPDAATARFRSMAHHWVSTCGLSDDRIAELIRADGIDVLVDLAGHTTGNRLLVFARKPAPVQVTYLGYPATTGLTTVDYCLTDAIADPRGETACFTEELIRLPHGFCCYAPPAAAPEIGPLPARAHGYVTFGSLHTLVKLNADVLDLWCAVLRAVPEAHLMIFRHTLQGAVRERLLRQLTGRGVEPHRIELRHTAAGGSHLDIYRRVDVSLDTFPWSGHTTACESLWMGVPVVTLRGQRHAGRLVASVLTQVGLSDLIADTPEQFSEIAARLAGDVERLADLRERWRELMRHSSLCDGRQFARQLEDAFRALWRRWCAARR